MREKELPEGWEETTVEEVSSRIHYGYTASSTTVDTGTKILRITDIQHDGVEWEKVPFCVIDEKEANKFLLKEGDLVFARTGATVGKSFLIKDNVPNSVFASYLIRIIMEDDIDKQYLAYFFKSGEYWQQITDKARGIGQPNVNAQILSKIKLPLPPLAEQKRIVAKLDEAFQHLDTLQAKLARIPELLKNFRQAVLTQAVTGKLTEEWREENETCDWQETTVGSFMSEVKDKIDPTKVDNTNYIGLEHLEKDGALLGFGSSNTLKSIKTPFKVGDVLYGKLRPNLNKHIVAPFDGVCSTDIIVYRSSNIESANFFNYFLGLPETIAKAISNSKGINLPRISAKELNSYETSVPPLEEQKEIVRKVEALFAKADAIEAQYLSVKAKIDKLPQALLAKAFRGELVPQDAADEPAAVLLERVRGAKAGEGKGGKKRQQELFA